MAPTESKEAREAREEQERVDALAAQSQADATTAHPGLDDEKGSVNVGVEDGPVILTRGGVEVARFEASGGKVEVKNADERALVLGSVPGASID